MSRGESKPLSSFLTELQTKYNFETEPTKQWLVSERFADVGGLDCYEWLPTMARLSLDFSRYEIGTRRDDLEGLLALAKILNPDAQELDKVLSFWKVNPKYTFKEEGGWIFIGTDIEPTDEGLETHHGSIMTAYGLAIKSAIVNKTYEQMLADKRHKDWIRHAEQPSSRAMLFGESIFDKFEKASCDYEPDPERIVKADTLEDFPLATYKTSLNFAQGTLIRDGQSKEFDNISVDAYNGRPEVYICTSDTNYNNEREAWDRDTVRLILPIPGDVQIKKFADLPQLSYAKLEEEIENSKVQQKNIRDMDVKISVETNLMELKSKDGSFVLTIRTPKCDGCGIPVWKFPYSQPSFFAGSGTGNFYETNTSLGILRFLVDTETGEKTYCADCIEGVTDKYVDDHPYAHEKLARETARRLMDSMGYKDVQIWEDQVWHIRDGWEFFTKIEYERKGRKVIRHTGIPTLTDNGHFEPNMFPREYVEFRYKV